MSVKGKISVVTGANTGIGKATAEGLAREGATVILACRDEAKARAAEREIRDKVPDADLRVMRLDLGSQASIRGFVTAFDAQFGKLDVLVNNAAIMPTARGLTQDGIETQFGVNHLGPFLLTNLLLPKLKAAAPSRVVVVSSKVHHRATLDFDDLQSERKYSTMSVYGRSKLANILFVRALAKRLAGSGVTVNALHPGVISTELGRSFPAPLVFLAKLFFKTPAEGAKTSLYLSTSKEVEGVTGKYFDACKDVSPSAAAQDDAAAERLWTVSEKLTGLAS
jgi:NAD(P)-dependent dehydrogenase (short-subunit alcohol dehydrogenase family)